MKTSKIPFAETVLPLYSVNTLIIGSGTAALSCALQLVEEGQQDLVIVTSQWGGGTSNNAGSDKQTYYKQSLAGDQPDSPRLLAEDLFRGKCMHGDIALCEAQHSLQAFFRLVRLGVPFPHDRYGAYPGYKTDHDPRARGTSAGPLTSRYMFEALARALQKEQVPVLDRHEVIALLHEGDRVIGAVALNLNRLHGEDHGFCLINARNVVLGTGGPAALYEQSVYPESQQGSIGLALEIGAQAQNLTESQFGLASLVFRWNLSGTYQQVIPRYLSTDSRGEDEREFLNDFFPDLGRLATAIFLKGYQWPFDPAKVAHFGSSLIDLLVYRETVHKGRRVFLDYTRNPSVAGDPQAFSFAALGEEARNYLARSEALLASPIERLLKMNPQAVDLYRQQGIDLSRGPLEIAVCAQHNNGGLKGNLWWESNIKHLFPVGEVNGSHGVARPGGASLNAGQVGGIRAGLYMARKYAAGPPAEADFLAAAGPRIKEQWEWAQGLLHNTGNGNLAAQSQTIRKRITRNGALVRDPTRIRAALAEAWDQVTRLRTDLRLDQPADLPAAFKNLDLCLSHAFYLQAVAEYLDRGGRSRGSFLVRDPGGDLPCPGLEEEWRFSENQPGAWVDNRILEISRPFAGPLAKTWAEVRPIPEQDLWFEKLWADFREDRIIQ